MRPIRMLLITAAMAMPTVGGTTPGTDCMGEPCDTINRACTMAITDGRDCVD